MQAKQDLEGKTYDRITKLPAYSSFADINDNFKTLLALANEDSRPASIGMISALARIWDPKGTVREGEYAINSAAQSALDSIYGDWREIVIGKGKLGADGKKAVIEAAAQKYNSFGSSLDVQQKALLDNLQQQGGNPANVPIMSYSAFKGVDIYRNKTTGEIKIVPKQ